MLAPEVCGIFLEEIFFLMQSLLIDNSFINLIIYTDQGLKSVPEVFRYLYQARHHGDKSWIEKFDLIV